MTPLVMRDPGGAIRYAKADSLAQAQANGAAARAEGIEDIPPSTYRADQKKAWRFGWATGRAPRPTETIR